MKVLVACEFSGIVREAFAANGHDAWSCDLLPTEIPGQHIQGEVEQVLDHDWDLMIAHPPCTFLAASGARWFYDMRYSEGRKARQAEAHQFVRRLYDSAIPRVAIENPIGYLSTLWRKPDFVTHPYEHGHAETKQTCFWLKGLDPLRPTKMMQPPYENRVHRERPGVDRWKRRSRTLPGIAKAMAEQWGQTGPVMRERQAEMAFEEAV
jgi:hypothetical protein